MRFFRLLLLLLVVCAAGTGAYVWFYGVPEDLPFGLGRQTAENEDKKPPTPVRVAKSEQADVTLTAEAVGNVVAVDSVTLSPRVTARVDEVLFTDGQTVEKGQLLVRLDPAEAEAAVATAEARSEELRQATARADQLAASGAGPQAVADDRGRQLQAAQSQVESARERRDDYNIRAPFAGRLGLRNISAGALAQPDTTVATLDSVDPIEVRFALPENYLGQVKMDAPVHATTPAFPDEEFAGRVAVISNRVDPALRTVQVEASLPNRDGRLLPGMLMNVTVDLGKREKAIVVPPLAVKLQGATHFVYTIAEGKAKRIDVKVGQRDPDRVEIVEGLEGGEEVIVQGPQNLASGQQVEKAKEDGADKEAKPEAQAASADERPAG